MKDYQICSMNSGCNKSLLEKKLVAIKDCKVLLQRLEDNTGSKSTTGVKRSHKCDECESTFTLATHLKRHQLAVHRGVIRFKCSTCDYVTFYRHTLKTHLLVHSDEKPYKCNTCDYACKRASHLKIHKMVHSKVRIKPHKCDECELTFTHTSHLKAHQLSVHRKVKRFKCLSCNYVTFHKSNFKTHLLVHSGETPYKCNTCDYECKEASGLRRHQAVHRKSHKCDQCQSSFTLVTHLKTHQLSVHGVVTRFKCSICDYVTFYKYTLERHLKSHRDLSNQNLHTCLDCNYYTKSLSGLQRHLSNHRLR